MSAGQNDLIPAKGTAKRKRGGQPGNSNAFKHGLYSKNFSLAERRGLEAAKGIVLGDEIALLRVLIRRFAEEILSSQAATSIETAEAEAATSRLSAVQHTLVCGQNLAVISEAMLRLASLLRTDHMLGGSQSSTFIKQLSLVLQEISDEKALDER